jgi:hypothetical protein
MNTGHPTMKQKYHLLNHDTGYTHLVLHGATDVYLSNFLSVTIHHKTVCFTRFVRYSYHLDIILENILRQS